MWGGNSVIHIDQGNRNESQVDASLRLNNVDLSSSSGRGIVAVGGAKVQLKNTFLHECAATGVYVSGEDTSVEIESCDIVGNGKGSQTGGFIPSGHSGIFVVEGNVRVENSNISYNMGAGVSVMTTDPVSQISIRDTDLEGNLAGRMDYAGLPVTTRTETNTRNGVPRARTAPISVEPSLVLV